LISALEGDGGGNTAVRNDYFAADATTTTTTTTTTNSTPAAVNDEEDDAGHVAEVFERHIINEMDVSSKERHYFPGNVHTGFCNGGEEGEKSARAAVIDKTSRHNKDLVIGKPYS